MKKEYLLSILIPTKNREKYLKGTIEQILRIKDKRIQIVIQDNSDISAYNQIKDILEINDNIKYNYTSGIVSFVDNFDKGVQLCEGEYVCLIGDDDGIMPQIVSVVEWAKKNNKNSIKPSLNAVYFWPDSKARGNKIDDGYLVINKVSKEIQKYDTKKELQKLLDQGCQDYLSLGIPKLYHGIIKKECLDKIKNRIGKYFGGLSPDIYIATALSLISEEVVEINFPLTVPGICSKSGSSDSVTGKHTGKLEDAPHFRGHKEYIWSELVPKFYSVETIWADSSIAAIQDFKEEKFLKSFNIEFLTLECLKKYPKYKKFILDNYKNNLNAELRKKMIIENSVKYLNYSVKKLISKVIKLSKKIASKLEKQNKNYYEKSDVKNISEAVKNVEEYLLENNIKIENILDNFKG